MDIGQLLHDVARRFTTRSAAQGLRIDVRCVGRLTISGDPGRLDQAVANLVDNALRHGRTDVALEATSQPGGVTIRVSDRGPGISEDLRPHAFDPFSRDAHSRPGRGHGLGLAIVDAIVAAHRGTTAISQHRTAPGPR